MTASEWQALSAYVNHITKPEVEPILRQATVRWIAQLGGFLDRRSDGEPGVKVLRRGWQLFHPVS